MKTTNYSKLAIYTAIFSFMIGTGLFAFYKTTHNYDIAGIGILYIPLAFTTNLIILFIVIIEAINNQKERRQLLLCAAFMLLNIPFTILYLNYI